MKKLFLLPLMLLATLVFDTACSEDAPFADRQEQTPPEEGEAEEGNNNVDGTNGRYLVLYCSRTGNTERMAQTIQSALDCDMVEVVPETPYDNDYNTMLDRAQEELNAIGQSNYPAITTTVESFADYDIVFIGYPIWFGHIATPMQSFLHSHADLLAGKRIALFASSGSSGISTSEREAASLVPDATFAEPLHLTSSTLGDMENRIPAWLEQLGVNRESGGKEETSLSIRITVGEQSTTATLLDNPTARDFLARLPLTVTLEDYAGEEKIFYPAPALETEGSPRGGATVAGDIKLYAPWGDVAIFYEDGPDNNGLIPIGHIDDNGISLFRVSGNIADVRFEHM